MKTSIAGRKMIEGFEGCILHAYKDSGGVPTIGYGHTSAAGAPFVVMGMTITAMQADSFLSNDLGVVEKSVMELVEVSLNQPQFDALVSFQYNTGWLAHPQCSLLKALNSGNYNLAANDFGLYDEAAGKVLVGLEKRRAAERTLFLTGVYPSS